MSEAQVVIIGGGAMGTSLLYHLTKMGWSDVVLVEKNDLTHGSTWHAAGLCTHFAHNATIQELRATSVRLYRDILPSETGASVGFHPSGAMRITRNPDRMDEFAHVRGLSDFTGYPLRLLTPEDIAELHPLTELDGLIGGIYEPDDGHVDPSLATNAMAQVARKNGGVIQRYNAVGAINRDGDYWRVETQKGMIRTRHIVNAAGTWCWEIGQMMGVNVPSVPMLHQYLVTDRIDAVSERQAGGLAELPMIRDPEESWYIRQERDGLILGPYEKEAQTWSIDGVPPEFGADLMPPDLDRVEHIIEMAMERVPAVASAGIKSVINGPITFSPDANPLIGPAFGLDNAWLLTSSSMGVMEGGGAGWFLAHWMTHGAPPMDALAVDPRRFGQWADRSYRIEKATECFGLQFGVHYPYEERPAARDKRKSALHDELARTDAIFGAAYGWERPNYFSSGEGAPLTFGKLGWHEAVAREVACVENHVSLADLSPFSKFEVRGSGVAEFLATLGSNTAPKVGRIGLIHALTPAGGTQSEFTVSRTDKDAAYLTSAAAAEEMDYDLLRSHADQHSVILKNLTADITIIGVMGPKSRDVLTEICDVSLSNEDFPWLSVRTARVAGHSAKLLRVSYVGTLGWEIHVPRANAVSVYQSFLKAGKPYNIGHFGAYAMNSMRLEKGYRAWGMDLTSERTPLESGLSFLVKPGNRAFVGRDALIERSESDSRWDMVLLEIEGDAHPYYAHNVLKDSQSVGIVTSAAYGHRTKKNLALAYLRDRTARTGLKVDILGRHYPAQILKDVPFDPQNLLLKG